jgi:hypothetical protein
MRKAAIGHKRSFLGDSPGNAAGKRDREKGRHPGLECPPAPRIAARKPELSGSFLVEFWLYKAHVFIGLQQDFS